MMNVLNNMRIFVRVAEAGSFTAAAEQLNIAIGKASKAISELEVHLGARLLNRTTRRIALTDAGSRYLKRSTQILALVDVSEAEAGAAKTSPSGVLRIHAPFSFGETYVVPALTRYLELHPLVRAELTLSQSVPDLLDEGYDVSFQVAATQLPDSALVSMKICTIPSVLCASPAYIDRHGTPASVSELDKHMCMQLVTPHFPVSHWKFGGPESVTEIELPPGKLRVNSASALAVALTEGLGIGPLPLLSALPLLRTGALVRVLPGLELPSTSVFAVYASREYLDAKIKTWVAFLREFVEAALRVEHKEAGCGHDSA